MKGKSQGSAVKKRHWAFVLYPESAPENWKEIIQDTHLPGAISPLHDKDVNPTGEPKKPHYHVMLCYDGPTTYKTVERITVGQLHQTIPIPVEQVRGYYRYFTHKDNPEKAQYDEADIKPFNGFSIIDFAELKKSEVESIIIQLENFIDEEKIYEYKDLMVRTRSGDVPPEWHEVADSRTYHFSTYITSARHKVEEVAKNKNIEKYIEKAVEQYIGKLGVTPNGRRRKD